MTKMRSLCFNPSSSIARNWCLLFSLLAINSSKGTCDDTSFNEVIEFLPRDCLVKLFFNQVRQTNNLHEVQTPYIIICYHNDWCQKLSSTSYGKLFHLDRVIRSRTKRVVNIVQFSFKNHMKDWLGTTTQTNTRGPNAIYNFVRGPEYSGTNTDTMLLGNEELYEMTSREVRTIFKVMGDRWILNNVFVFNLQKRMSVWRACGINPVLMELVCMDSADITDRVLDVRALIGRIWKIEKGKYHEYYSQWENLNSDFQSPVDVIFVNEIFRRSNDSLNVKGVGWIAWMASRIILPSTSSWPEMTDILVLIDGLETRFLSCYSIPVLRFDMYVKPFKPQLWIGIGTTLTIIVVFIYVYNRKKKLSPSFSPFFFFVSTLVEEPYSVPTALWNDSKFKTVTIVWLLTAVIFTNLYIGLMIGDLSAPIRDQALTSFKDVFGVGTAGNDTFARMVFWENHYAGAHGEKLPPGWDVKYPFNKFGCSGQLDYYDHDLHLQQFRKPDHFALLQTPSTICDAAHRNPSPQSQRLGVPQMYSVYNRLAQARDFWDENFLKFQSVSAYYTHEFFSHRFRHYPKHPNFTASGDGEIPHYMDSAIEKELIECEKSVLLSDSNEIRTELHYLKQNYPEIRFYVSNDTMEQGGKRRTIWNFENPGTSIVPYYLQALLQAGVRDAVLSIQAHKTYLQRRQGTKLIKEMAVSPTVDMNGPTQTIFIILAAICSLAGLQFVLELIYCNRMAIYMFFRHLVIMYIAISCRILARHYKSLKQFVHLK
jgi:hypothetical protein